MRTRTRVCARAPRPSRCARVCVRVHEYSRGSCSLLGTRERVNVSRHMAPLDIGRKSNPSYIILASVASRCITEIRARPWRACSRRFCLHFNCDDVSSFGCTREIFLARTAASALSFSRFWVSARISAKPTACNRTRVCDVIGSVRDDIMIED